MEYASKRTLKVYTPLEVFARAKKIKLWDTVLNT